MTGFRGDGHVVQVGDGVPTSDEEQLAGAARGERLGRRGVARLRSVEATTTVLSQVGEDSGSNVAEDLRPAPEEGIVEREVWRHEAQVRGLRPGLVVPYRVVSLADGSLAGFRHLPPDAPAAPWRGPADPADQRPPGDGQHPANRQTAAATVGDIDAVFLAGDLVNIPDRASEWFDDTRGSAFFPVAAGQRQPGRDERPDLRGRGDHPERAAVPGHRQPRGPGPPRRRHLAQRAGPAGRGRAGVRGAGAQVNPTGDPGVRAAWIEENSFSTTTYEEIFSLPQSSSGGETYYATTYGDVRLVSLYSTRIWRSPSAQPDPGQRTANTRHHDSAQALKDPLSRGYGEHIFEPVDAGSEQLE